MVEYLCVWSRQWVVSGSGGHHGEPPPKDAWWISPHQIAGSRPLVLQSRAGRRNQLGITYIKKSFNGRFQGCSGKACLCQNRMLWGPRKQGRMGSYFSTQPKVNQLWPCVFPLEIQIIGGNEFDWLIWITLWLERVGNDARKEIWCCYSQKKEWLVMSAVSFYLK